MRPFALLALPLFAFAACQSPQSPAVGDETSGPAPLARTAGAAESADGLTGRVWVSTTEGAAPGALRIFLPDGTLLQTSCGETYRLSRYRADGPGRVVLAEDVGETPVTYTVQGDALTLRLSLVAGDEREERYRASTQPTTCPDLR